MKILNVNISINSSLHGGTAERTYQMSRFLAKNGTDCSILTFSSSLTPEKIMDLQGVKIIELPYLWKRFYIPNFSFSKIKQAVYQADIIHLMNHWTLLNALIYFYARRFKKPYVVCPAGALPISGRSQFLKKIYNRLIGYKIVRNAKAHIAIATNELEHFQHYGIDKHRVTLIPNGVNAADLNLTTNSLNAVDVKIPLENFILFMGRLNYIKGPDLLLQAFANVSQEYNDYHLIYAGPDEGMLSKLKNLAKELDIIQRVHFIGTVSGLNKIYLYKKAKFLVVPSRQEAMSIVVLEAGVLGKPVLITDQCGFNEIEKVNGGHSVPATVIGLQTGLKQLLSRSDLLNEQGQNLRAHILKNYTWDLITEKIITLYQQIL